MSSVAVHVSGSRRGRACGRGRGCAAQRWCASAPARWFGSARCARCDGPFGRSGEELFPNVVETQSGLSFVEFFQNERDTSRKGIVVIHLSKGDAS